MLLWVRSVGSFDSDCNVLITLKRHLIQIKKEFKFVYPQLNRCQWSDIKTWYLVAVRVTPQFLLLSHWDEACTSSTEPDKSSEVKPLIKIIIYSSSFTFTKTKSTAAQKETKIFLYQPSRTLFYFYQEKLKRTRPDLVASNKEVFCPSGN